MRFALLFLLLSSLIFSQYAEPPIDEVQGNNSITAHSVAGVYNPESANHSEIMIGFDTPIFLNVSASVDLLGLSLLLDNITYPVDGLFAIVAYGHQYETLLPGDYDGDGCTESMTNTTVMDDLDVLFTFRNLSESVHVDSPVIPVPSYILEAMHDSSGSESLNVSVDGWIAFVYEIDDPEQPFCEENLSNYSEIIFFSLNDSFAVGGEDKLFFLRSPVLREQWFRNNHFDVIVFSQSPIYLAEVSIDDKKEKIFTLRNFSIITDEYGIKSIVSHRINGSNWSESRSEVSPLPLEHADDSFSYVYGFNYSYPGIGEKTLSLEVKDSFLGEAEYHDMLLSRMLTFNGDTTETGEPANETPSRKSTSFTKENRADLEIGLGLIALVLILAFVNFWITR